MSISGARIALKPYLEEVANDCRELSKQELTDVIVELAKDEPASGRVGFLRKFQSLLPENRSVDMMVGDIETILDEIQALKESIAERIEDIENGDYEQLDDWDWDEYHDDDEPDYINEELSEDLAALFQDAENLFLNDQIEVSGIVYGALFNLKDEIDQYGVTLQEFGVDIREERARYARCVYDTSDKHKRMDAFAAAMKLYASNQYNVLKTDASYPLLQDVIDCREKEMADLQSFYPAWKSLLIKKGTNGRPASLLTEAVKQLEGIEGIANLARMWKESQPYGYQFWLNCLKKENRLDDIVDVSKEALQVLEKGDARENVSEFLIEAGELLDNGEYVLEGKREKFFSNSCDENLLGLQNEAIKQEKRDEELGTLLAFFAKRKEMDDGGKSLYLKSMLMAGRLDDAFSMVKDSKSIGWSYGLNIGLVFGAVAVAVADCADAENIPTIRDLMARYAGNSSVYSYQITVKERDCITFYDEIMKGLKKIVFSKNELEEYFAWALKIGKKRVDHIVSKQHRRAYERAAQVLGSLAEVYAAKGDVENARKIVNEYCKEKYNRHSAFRREVQVVISRSMLLKNASISG